MLNYLGSILVVEVEDLGFGVGRLGAHHSDHLDCGLHHVLEGARPDRHENEVVGTVIDRCHALTDDLV